MQRLPFWSKLKTPSSSHWIIRSASSLIPFWTARIMQLPNLLCWKTSSGKIFRTKQSWDKRTIWHQNHISEIREAYWKVPLTNIFWVTINDDSTVIASDLVFCMVDILVGQLWFGSWFENYLRSKNNDFFFWAFSFLRLYYMQIISLFVDYIDEVKWPILLLPRGL